ncbi:MAG: Astacin [Pseudomonadota bacterium]
MLIPKGQFRLTKPTEEEESLSLVMETEPQRTENRAGLTDQSNRWPNMRVPYVLNANLSQNARNTFIAAIREFMSKTPILFEEATSSDRFPLRVSQGESWDARMPHWAIMPMTETY